MPKRVVVVAVMVAAFLNPVAAVAQKKDDLGDPGRVPGDFFYAFDRLFERVGTFFTFDQEAKIRRYITLAEERLAELNVLSEEEQVERVRVQQALDDYEEQLDRAVSLVEEMEADGERVEGLATEVGEATLKHLEVLALVYERVPVDAQQAIKRAMDVSRKGHDTAVEVPSRGASGSDVVDEVAQEGLDQIEKVKAARNRGVPVPQTNAERQLGPAQLPPPPGGVPGGPPAGVPGVPPEGIPGGPPAGVPGGPPEGIPGGPPASVSPVDGRPGGHRQVTTGGRGGQAGSGR